MGGEYKDKYPRPALRTTESLLESQYIALGQASNMGNKGVDLYGADQPHRLCLVFTN
jgi:hypothetical protein